ncbi:glutamate-rich WD repeat-containing protein 1-like isoform X2 [Oscarella lobularis]|uniref:glutamate-rich WD repeat-containing protein 1-like isoform X2 n=1 Tax=Oscarella lobularis TaxID=121494 RepID=UPI003313F76B
MAINLLSIIPDVSMDEDVKDDTSSSADSDEDNEMETETSGGGTIEDERVYLPGEPVPEGEELVYDRSAYQMYHAAQTGAPCLSFDIIRDKLGDNRTEYPMTCYLVGGTQASRPKDNAIVVIKMSNMKKTYKEEERDDDEDASDSDDSDDEELPTLDTVHIQHDGGVNRIRVAPIESRSLVSTWSDSGSVHIVDVGVQLTAVDHPAAQAQPKKPPKHSVEPLFTFPGHQTEGFAMDWSRMVPGRLATGDCNGNIHVWNPRDGGDGSWHVDQRSYSGHALSVEDIQWSPNEATVFASCSVDKTIRVWDVRAPPSKACMLTQSAAHDADVNVISWNRYEPMIISGGDDGVVKIWDLRQFKTGKTAAVFKHHTAPITSVEWHPTDATVFGAAGEDNQISLWDLALERDAEASQSRDVDVPPQLLFIHMGQQDIKEIHWHPQIPGLMISTAQTGFNVFRTISV